MSKLMLSYLFKTNLAAFRSAILDDNTDKICRLLDIERDFLHKQIDSEGNTALLLAIEHASPLTVRLLLEQGAAADQTNSDNLRTPLSAIATRVFDDYTTYKAQRKLEMAKILLNHGAFVDKPSPFSYKDDNGREFSGKETPLMTAVRKGNLPLAKLLIERKANVNYLERGTNIRPIHYAINNGDEAMFDLLESSDALCCSLTTTGNNNLLHWFCYKKENDKYTSLLNKLINKGCDMNAENSDGYTPLMLAVKYDMTNTCRTLLKHGVEAEKSSTNGNQAIDVSVPGSECSQILIQRLSARKSSIDGKEITDSASATTMLWKHRIDPSRRFTIEISQVHPEESIRPKSTALSELGQVDEEDGSQLSHPYVFPSRRSSTQEIETKYDRIWDKLLQAKHKRRSSKSSNKHRTCSVDGVQSQPA